MTEPAFHHPVASLWQRCLNAVPVPPRGEQRDVVHGALVRARWVWERDGETWLDGRVMSVWERRGYEDVVLVHRLHRDARGQTHGEWLWARDVDRGHEHQGPAQLLAQRIPNGISGNLRAESGAAVRVPSANPAGTCRSGNNRDSAGAVGT